MQTISDKLTAAGFKMRIPFYNHWRKDVDQLNGILIDSNYRLQKSDKVEDEGNSCRYFRVTKINLPHSETKIFNQIQNALDYAKSV